jgi:hypothetical protein
VLSEEPANAQATQMQTKALELEAHVRNLETSRRRGEWAMARIALDRCLRVVEAEGSEIPIEWRVWRVEIELARGNWDGANSAAKCVLSLFCFLFLIVFTVFYLFIVMRCGCSRIRLTCSRFADSFSSFVAGSRRHYNTRSRHCDTIPVTSRLNVCASALKRSSG